MLEIDWNTSTILAEVFYCIIGLIFAFTGVSALKNKEVELQTLYVNTYPYNFNEEELDRFKEKLPSKSVIVPLVVPSSITDTPVIASFWVSITTPVIDFVCAII